MTHLDSEHERMISDIADDVREYLKRNHNAVYLLILDIEAGLIPGLHLGPWPCSWISVDHQMPPPGQIVLATYRNTLGMPRMVRAEWITQFTVEAESDADEIGIYNEKDDTYYLPEGWWETIDNWDDYARVYVSEGQVTHWTPLPHLPT